jgi:O-antigen ligase
MSRWWFSLLLCILVFLVPSNLFLSLPTGAEYIRGLRVDYLIPKIYASDFVTILIILSYLYVKRNKIHNAFKNFNFRTLFQPSVLISILLGMTLVIRQLFSAEPLISLIALIHISLLLTAAVILYKLRRSIEVKTVFSALIVTLIFQSSVGLFQWVTQHSVYGYLFFGETNFSHPLGLAKTIWKGRELILPYGTTAHPNIFGGVLAVYMVGVYHLLGTVKLTKSYHFLLICTAIISCGMLLLTQSVSAILALLVGLGLVIYQRHSIQRNSKLLFIKVSYLLLIWIIVSILSVLCMQFFGTIYSENDSLSRRAILNLAGIELFLQHPMVGVGLSNFTIHLDKTISYGKVILPFLQPAHNVFVLLLAEVGILGIAFVLNFRKHTWLNARVSVLLLMLVPLAVVDHYLFTIQTGQLLTVITPLLFMKVRQT